MWPGPRFKYAVESESSRVHASLLTKSIPLVLQENGYSSLTNHSFILQLLSTGFLLEFSYIFFFLLTAFCFTNTYFQGLCVSAMPVLSPAEKSSTSGLFFSHLQTQKLYRIDLCPLRPEQQKQLKILFYVPATRAQPGHWKLYIILGQQSLSYCILSLIPDQCSGELVIGEGTTVHCPDPNQK